ncbi:hypothetical protein NM208_g10064 [Fusarium decemcellulare]|uniref:Uncharacterized protein n=1 Tax=Fusarium decemcellulare TaxID=57161 RepID=A0ACC1RZ86_9HYPO|nr:hypothetical protein NM208_g10064 [Fusarium decemcellulare]
MATAQDLVLQHPTNPIYNTFLATQSDKVWSRNYAPIKNIICHSGIDGAGTTQANFEEAFLPLYDDDTVRLRQPAVRPNSRHWRFETEADCENWFNTEIVSVVLSAFNAYPVLMQTSHAKPLSEETITENTDLTFSVKIGNRRHAVAIGEMKRNILEPRAWRTGNVSAAKQQEKLSKELRGYAHKYQCPQVFCFDGAYLLLLQFRATKPEDLLSERCPVDTWVLPIKNTGCSLRYALYRILVQGWRRCQASASPLASIGGLAPEFREFYSGLPIWREGQTRQRSHPRGFQRSIDATNGSVFWSHPQYAVEWETRAFW